MFDIEDQITEILKSIAQDKYNVRIQVKVLERLVEILTQAIYTNNLDKRNDTLELMRETIHILINMLEPEKKTEE